MCPRQLLPGLVIVRAGTYPAISFGHVLGLGDDRHRCCRHRGHRRDVLGSAPPDQRHRATCPRGTETGPSERAYQEVQRAVERYAQWADATMPLMSVGDHDLHPPLPGNDGQVLEASALRLYWSPEVRQLVQEWTDARNRLAVQSLAARVHESLTQNAWLKAPELKTALRAAEDALLARMSYELLTVESVRRRWRPQVARRRHRTTPADADTAPPVLDRQRASAN